MVGEIAPDAVGQAAHFNWQAEQASKRILTGRIDFRPSIVARASLYYGTMRRVSVLAVMEATTVTGPAKNLIRFARQAGGAAAVSIVTFFRPGECPNPFTAAVEAAGIELDAIPERRAFDLRVLPALKEIVARRNPDIVQTHGVKAHFLIRCTGLNRGRRWLAIHHGYTDVDLKMRVYNQFNRLTLPGADRVVTVCWPFVEVLAAQGVKREKIRVLPNAVEPFAAASAAQVAALRQEWGIREGERVVLTVGRFSAEKGHADLVAAVARLAETVRGVRLVMVGDGLERQRLERAAQAAGLAESIVMPGHRRDMAVWYGMADLFVLPSRSEGSPNALLEAMSAGLPIIATAVGGVPETIAQDRSGLLVPSGDPAALAQAMARLLEDPERAARLGAAAAEDAAARFSVERYRESLLAIYEELCGRP
jgi:glycosyltransferase involved in cell wall biosynthesis